MNHTIIDVEKWSPADLPSCSESCFGETFSGNSLCKIKLPEGTNPSMYFIGASDKFVVKDKKGILWLILELQVSVKRDSVTLNGENLGATIHRIRAALKHRGYGFGFCALQNDLFKNDEMWTDMRVFRLVNFTPVSYGVNLFTFDQGNELGECYILMQWCTDDSPKPEIVSVYAEEVGILINALNTGKDVDPILDLINKTVWSTTTGKRESAIINI
jgi:hypothetical protein